MFKSITCKDISTEIYIVLQQVCFVKQFYVPRADYLTLRLSFVTVSA
jgi:hypothetical protein